MGRVVLVLNCEDAQKWADYIGDSLWKPLLSCDTDEDVFHVHHLPENDFPTVESVASADLVVISGSHYSAYEKIPWIRRFHELLPQYVATQTRILGCCFGHQVLARALGGDVGRNPSGRFVLTVECIELQEDAMQAVGLLAPLQQALSAAAAAAAAAPAPAAGAPSPAASLPAAAPEAATAAAAAPAPGTTGAVAGAGHRAGQQQQQQQPPDVGQRPSSSGPCSTSDSSSSTSSVSGCCMLQVESHGDCVTRLPPGARLLAKSATAACEMWSLGTNVLAFQFHPELPPELVLDKIWPAVSGNGALSADESAASEAALARGPAPHAAAFAAVLRHYADHGCAVQQQQTRQQQEQEQQQREQEEQGKERVQPHTPVTASDTATASAPPTASASAPTAAGVLPQQQSQARGAPEPAAAPSAAAAAPHQRPSAAAAVGSELERLVGHVRASFGAGLRQGVLQCDKVTAMNDVAADRCGHAADVATALAQFSLQLSQRQAPVQEALTALAHLEGQVDQLTAVVDHLDAQSRQLAADAGVAEPEAGGMFAWARK